MHIFIGADHRGFLLKRKIIKYLQKEGHEVTDVGIKKPGVKCDYPKFSHRVATGVAKNPKARGILVCMTGIGHSIAANKVPGAMAALCCNKRAAHYARAHNNSNILVLSAKFVSRKELFDIIRIWLITKFEGGRHARRVNQIKRIERSYLKKVK